MVQKDPSSLQQTAFASCEKLWITDHYQNKADAKVKDAAILSTSLKC